MKQGIVGFGLLGCLQNEDMIVPCVLCSSLNLILAYSSFTFLM